MEAAAWKLEGRRKEEEEVAGRKGEGTDSFHWLWGKASVVNGWQRHLSRQWTPTVYIPTWRPQLLRYKYTLVFSSSSLLSLSSPVSLAGLFVPGHFRWRGWIKILRADPTWWFLPTPEYYSEVTTMNTSAKREGRIGLTLGKILTNSMFAGCEKGGKKGREISVSIKRYSNGNCQHSLGDGIGSILILGRN